MPRSKKRSPSPKRKKEDTWYYLLGGEVERGPVTTSALQDLKRTGRVHDETPVRRAARGEKRGKSLLPRSLTRRRSKTSPSVSKKRKWSPYYRTVPNANNRFDSVGLFPDLPPTALEQKALKSMLASISSRSA